MKLAILSSHSAAFRRFLDAMLKRRGGDGAGIDAAVAKIIAAVRRRGDRALIEFGARFDHVKLTPARLRVRPAEMEAARRALPPAERRALELAARRIREFHRRTLSRSFTYRDASGMRLGQTVRALARVGIYVPGGQGAYPSTVLMNAIPARVAGVDEIVMVSPPSPEGDSTAAQAVAALAYGTRTIGAVDKIVGPGNAWVQTAKRLVYGAVDIDKMAGPSEVLVIADGGARAEWVAADLIAQAEHGSGDEAAVLLTPSRAVAERVATAIEDALADLPRAAAVRRVFARRGALVVVDSLEEAFALANRIAPEHLELDLRDAPRWLGRVRAAGAVFVGELSPAPLGDYLAGPNHVLPTGGAARFASPLGAYDFVARTSMIEAPARTIEKLAPAVAQP